jgi:hypothetical protein
MPPAVLAAMAEQLETFLARSLAFHKPPKVSFPSEGPWRDAVREHLRRHCPEDLALLDAAARQARAVPLEAAIFPAPPLDPAHAHAPALADLRGACQLPGDPELGAGIEEREPIRAPSLGLVREFEETLTEVNDRLVRVGPADPLVALRRTLARIDHPTEGADPEQLRQAAVLLDLELDRRMTPPGRDFGRSRAGPGGPEEWAELVAFGGRVGEREIGGRSL